MLRSLVISLACVSALAAHDSPVTSAEVDRLVDEQLVRDGRSPAASTDDATFVRRAYLDIIGRIPTSTEALAFIDDRSHGKRTTLVDNLLESPGYESHLFHWWADLVRLKTEPERRMSGEPFAHWIKESIAADMAFDEMVRAMLTATGPAHEPGNGATGYLMRDRGMLEDSISTTTRVFLGTRIECAQCHNHPYADWTQRQYYELVAFAGGIDYKVNLAKGESGAHFSKLRDNALWKDGKLGKGTFRRAFRELSHGIAGSGFGAMRLPPDYAYDDGRPGSYVRARTLDGRELTPEPTFGADSPRGDRKAVGIATRTEPVEQNSRAALAEWIASSENEFFVRVIANRMWKRVMGVGLIEPIDDLDEDTEATAPELLAALEALMVDVDFDLREFQRKLYQTKAYQRVASTASNDVFAGAPALRRLTATQVWDSWMTLIVPGLDERIAEPDARAHDTYASYRELMSSDREELREIYEIALLRRTNRDQYNAMQADSNKVKRKARKLERKLAVARDAGRTKVESKTIEKLEALGVDAALLEAKRPDLWREAGLVRASDLASPTPPDHLLRTFGQSARDLPDGSHVDPTVPQALALMNGVVDVWMDGDAELEAFIVDELDWSDDIIETVFLATLTRRPSDAERHVWQRDIERDREHASLDLLWTLVNSHEFLFLR